MVPFNFGPLCNTHFNISPSFSTVLRRLTSGEAPGGPRVHTTEGMWTVRGTAVLPPGGT